MQKSGQATSDQVQMAVRVLSHFLGEDLLAVYRHGSAVLEGRRPLSDIDLLVIVDRGITDNQRRNLITALLPILPAIPSCLGALGALSLLLFVSQNCSEPIFLFALNAFMASGYERVSRRGSYQRPAVTQSIPSFLRKPGSMRRACSAEIS